METDKVHLNEMHNLKQTQRNVVLEENFKLRRKQIITVWPRRSTVTKNKKKNKKKETRASFLT